MDLSMIIGWVVAIILIINGITADKLMNFWDIPSILITVGGTLAAIVASYPFRILKEVPKHIAICFRGNKKYSVPQAVDSIVDLALIARQSGLLALEEIRVVKDMRNRVNRTVNCETANLQKTVAAALKQRKDIEYIRDAEGFENLPSTLAEMAEIRLEYPDVSLKELGTYLNPPVGKSGVNHRLRKLSEYADELRGHEKRG